MKTLDDFDSLETAVMQIIPPGETESIGSITFAGPGHPQTVAQSEKLQRQSLQHQRERERAQVNGRKWTPAEETPDQLRDRNVSFVVDRIVDWSLMVKDPQTGESVPAAFTREEAKRVLGRPQRGWLLAQCIEFLVNEDSFTPRSATI